MPRISVAGTTVPYSASGTGPALVMLHGTSIDAQGNFSHVIEHFTDQRRVICPDYAGCGQSTIPPGSLTLDLLIEQVAAVIYHASSAPVDLLGDSLGSVVAAATAARYPELIRRLILVAGWGNSLDPRHQLVFTTWAQLTTLDPELGNRYLISVAFKPAYLTGTGVPTIQAFIRSTPQPNIARRIDLGRRIDIRSRLPLVKCPTLIVRGSHDYLVPAYQTRVLHEQIRHSECVELDSGHAVFFEQPGAIVELTRRFLLRPTPQERDTPRSRPMP